MQTIILIRHGYPLAWDQNLKIRSSPTHQRHDSPLAAIGRQQAELTAAHLAATVGVDRIIASPFRRCLETADLIAAACACPVVADWRVGEVLLSDVLGSPFSPSSSLDPEWEERRAGAGKPAHPESDVTRTKRVTSVVAELTARKPLADRVAIVTHEIILKDLFNQLAGKSVTLDWHPAALAVLTRAKPTDRHWRLSGRLGSITHLGAADRTEPVAQITHTYHPLDSRS